jgi:hypothetical protein
VFGVRAEAHFCILWCRSWFDRLVWMLLPSLSVSAPVQVSRAAPRTLSLPASLQPLAAGSWLLESIRQSPEYQQQQQQQQQQEQQAALTSWKYRDPTVLTLQGLEASVRKVCVFECLFVTGVDIEAAGALWVCVAWLVRYVSVGCLHAVWGNQHLLEVADRDCVVACCVGLLVAGCLQALVALGLPVGSPCVTLDGLERVGLPLKHNGVCIAWQVRGTALLAAWGCGWLAGWLADWREL